MRCVSVCSTSQGAFMSMLSSPLFLRRVLLLDALSCVACGLLQLLLNQSMAQWLALPAALLSGTGVFLLVYAAAVAFIATRKPVPRTVVWVLVGDRKST